MLAALATSISSAPLASLWQTVGRRHIWMVNLADRMTVLQQDVRHVVIQHALLLLAIDHRLGDDQAVGAGGTGASCIGTHSGQGIGGPETVGHLHAGGSVEAGLEIIAHHTEVGQSHPAGLHCTRAGHSMALALLSHLRLDVLQIEKERGEIVH